MSIFRTSVALCSYNGIKYIKEQLSSILSQSITPDEIVICDDCSTDGTRELLENYIFNPQIKVKLVKNENRLGYKKNFEKAISLCSGDLIFLSDQDDIWNNKKIEVILNLFAEKTLLMVFTNANIVNENSELIAGYLWEKFKFNKTRQKQFKQNSLEALLKKDIITGATVAISKELVTSTIPFSEKFVHDTWIALIASALGGIDFIDLPLISYRIHSEQQIGVSKPKQPYFNNMDALEQECLKLKILKDKLAYIVAEQKAVDDKYIFYMNRRNYPQNLNRVFLVFKNLKFYSKYTSGFASMTYDLLGRSKK